MVLNKTKNWEFIGENGDFQLDDPQKSSYLYFPLANEAGMLSAITPMLHGDSKTGQNSFLLTPVSPEDLHNSRAARNFWIYSDKTGAWSASGNSSRQIAAGFTQDEEKVSLQCGFLWQKVARNNYKLGLSSEITSFVPMTEHQVELMRVKITNTGKESLRITPTAAIPVYGRSAENIRDHRHVTSLLHRVITVENGIEVQPTFSFDERGHMVNKTAYGVFGSDGDGKSPLGFFPEVEEFIGEGGNLEWPEAVVKNRTDYVKAGAKMEGYEAVGALRFPEVELKPGSSKVYILAITISEEGLGAGNAVSKYLNDKTFHQYLEECKKIWQDKLSPISIKSGDRDFDLWMKWVTVQPILRRIYGCSFLPHHDYGRGGRGWRDLWQDCLALLVMEPKDVRDLLINNYAGVRMDGSNATIIGSKPGEFIADRNNISRVWMDHGAWPFLTTCLYLDYSGDLDFLFEKQTFFKDRQLGRSKAIDEKWTPDYGNKMKTESGSVYQGSVLEHILVQNVVQFFNVGEHNNIRLEGADWNDALDMASRRGESVAFTAFYANNYVEIAKLLRQVQAKKGVREIEIAEEMKMLFDTLDAPVDYRSVEAKIERINLYYGQCGHIISGRKVKVPVESIAADLEKKAEWLSGHIRKNEWIKNKDGNEWFNGYYDNNGRKVEGDFPGGVRMTLTGQVFAMMGNVATDEQAKKAAASVKKYLCDPKIGGYRLNTNFHELKLDLGRGFGFAFGHKENGAMFSHMAVMYANALYRRGMVAEGFDVLDSIYKLSSDFEYSRIFPGVPEYINEKRRGMYHYLTGSASWLLLTMLVEVYGVKGSIGDLVLEPKLLKRQFDDQGEAKIHTLFAGRALDIVYRNKSGLEFGKYSVRKISIDGQAAAFETVNGRAVLERGVIEGLKEEGNHQVVVELEK